MTQLTAPRRLRFPSRRAYSIALLTLAILALARSAFAEQFNCVVGMREDVLNPFWEWSQPKCWLNAAKHNGAPTTAGDVGVIGDGMRLATFAPLGTPQSRPTIRMDKGGTLILGVDMVNPLTLAGGTVDGVWIGKSINGPISITADSTIQSRDVYSGFQVHVAGPLTNTAPVTLHVGGSVEWRSNSSKTFTGTISLDRGVIYLTAAGGTAQLGTGALQLAVGTRIEVWAPYGVQTPNFQLMSVNNDISGDGTILGGNNGSPQNLLVVNGTTLHPGSQGKPGTLCFYGSIDFHRSPAGAPVKLVIDVAGNGATATADYGQLAVTGILTNSLDNVDLTLRLKPDMTPDQAAKLHLMVLSASNPTDMIKPDFHPFHSVTVIAGDKKGTAAVKITSDPLTGLGIVNVSDITFK